MCRASVFDAALLKHLVVDNGFGVIEHKLPIVAVDEAQQSHQGHCDLGLDWSELWQGDVVVPVNLMMHRLFGHCVSSSSP